jgi:hypothetical protein
MATTKQNSAAKRSSSRSTAARKSSSATRSSNGRAPAKKRAPAKRKATTRTTQTRATSNSSSNGVPGAIKQVAKPAVAVGAAAAGLAGGLVLRSRTRRKTVLGVKMPSGIGKTLSGIDAKSVAKSFGQASKKFAKTTKSVSKDLERAGDQAERIGKILD